MSDAATISGTAGITLGMTEPWMGRYDALTAGPKGVGLLAFSLVPT